MVPTHTTEELALNLRAGPEHLATVRAFVGETWRSLGFEEEAVDDARVAASEALAELFARRGAGSATVAITVDARAVTAEIRLHPGSGEAPAGGGADGDRRRSLMAAVIPGIRLRVEETPATISFVVPRPV
jgi:hypothetical protein